MIATDTVVEQLEALQTGAGIFPLTDRGFLRITGPDAARWLNGMVTNNIKDLASGEGNYNFLLNAQGRIQGDCTIYREPGEGEATFLLETDTSQLEVLHQTLDRFIIMDDVEISQGLSILGHTSPGMAVLGKDAAAFVTKAVSEIEDHQTPADVPASTSGAMRYAQMPARTGFFSGIPEQRLVIVMRPPVSALPQFNLWFEGEEDLQQLRRTMESAGAIDLSDSAQEALRILNALPRYGVDIRNSETARDLPQETAQTHALNFNKGCYLGQEIVERIRSRGQVHRMFTAFTLTGSLPALPAPLEANGKPAGELTSALQIGDTLHALGYLRREFAAAPLTYPNGTATPRTV